MDQIATRWFCGAHMFIWINNVKRYGFTSKIININWPRETQISKGLIGSRTSRPPEYGDAFIFAFSKVDKELKNEKQTTNSRGNQAKYGKPRDVLQLLLWVQIGSHDKQLKASI